MAARCEVGGVDRADARADVDVGPLAPVVERREQDRHHSRLVSAACAPAGEHEPDPAAGLLASVGFPAGHPYLLTANSRVAAARPYPWNAHSAGCVPHLQRVYAART